MLELTQKTTLTEELGIAWKSPGSGPVPGAWIAVYKKTNNGLALRRILEPGQRYRRIPVLEPEDTLVSYAVHADQSWRHSFTQQLLTSDSKDHFYLTYTLRFSIQDVQAFLGKLRLDPIQLIVDETQRLVGRRARRYTWEEISSLRNDIANHLLQESGSSMGQQDRHNLSDLRGFSSRQGVQLQDVEIDCRLSKSHEENILKVMETRRQVDELKRKQAVRLENERHSQAIKSLQEAGTAETQIANAETNSRLRQIQRSTEFLDAAENQLENVMANIAQGTTTAPALAEVARVFTQLRREAAQASLTGGGSGHAPLNQLEGAAHQLQHTGPNGRSLPLLHDLIELQEHVAGMDIGLSHQQDLTVTVTHLIAEAWLGDRANHEIIARFSDQLETKFQTFIAQGVRFSPAQHEYLARFRSLASPQEVSEEEDFE